MKGGSITGDKTEEKTDDTAGKPEEGIYLSPPMPTGPTYQPLSEGEHIPLFQRQSGVQQRAWHDDLGFYQSGLFGLTDRAGQDGPHTLHPHSEYQRQTASWPRPPVNHRASFVGHPMNGMHPPLPIGPDAMDYRLRKLEGLVERMVDVQQTQMLPGINKSHSVQNGLSLAEGAVGGPTASGRV